MTQRNFRTALAVSALLLGAAPAALAQTTQGGSRGGVDGRNVSASTYGGGFIAGQTSGVSGGGEAQAVDGTASTTSDARYGPNRSMQRSTAEAQAEDERARSRTRTTVDPNREVIRSTTTSRYKERGAPPVRETIRTVTTPEGATTRTQNKGPKNK